MAKKTPWHSAPNIQNIPLRTDEARRIRDAFCRPDPVVTKADFDLLELRIFAELFPRKTQP